MVYLQTCLQVKRAEKTAVPFTVMVTRLLAILMSHAAAGRRPLVHSVGKAMRPALNDSEPGWGKINLMTHKRNPLIKKVAKHLQLFSGS